MKTIDLKEIEVVELCIDETKSIDGGSFLLALLIGIVFGGGLYMALNHPIE